MSPTHVARWEAAIRAGMEFNKAFNRHDVAGMMQLVSEDCVLEISGPAPDGAVHSGRDSISRFWQDYFRDSPDIHMEIEEIFSVGLRCILRWRCEWTDSGGKPGHIRGVEIFQLKEGLICQEVSYVKG